MKNFVFPILPIIMILLLGTAIYSTSVHSPFQFDDLGYILENPDIRDVTDIKTIWNSYGNPARFVGYYTFALNYHFHQYDVFGYHLVNIAIHVINAILVWWLIQLLLSIPKLQTERIIRHKREIALFAALIFLTHPIQTQAITYITQRFASLATLFYLASVCFYLKARLHNQYRYFFFTVMTAILGMFTKQITMTLPLLILLVEGCFLKRSHRIAGWSYFILLFIVPALYSFNVLGILSMQTASASHQGDVITSTTYLLTQFRVILTYLRLLFFPIGQNLDYDFPLSLSLWEGPTLWSFMTILLILWIAIKMYPRMKMVSFGIFWFFLTLSIESSVIVIKNVIFEHRCYLPSVGFSIVLCLGLFALIKEFKRFAIIMTVIVVTFSYLAFQRNKVWQTGVTLWSDAVRKSPHKARPYYNLGVDYYANNQDDLAFENYNEALKHDPQYVDAYNNRGILHQRQQAYDLALADFNKVIAIKPGFLRAYVNRGIVYKLKGQWDLALADYNMAIKFKPNLEEAYNNRGILYKDRRQYDLALDDFNKALAINSLYDEAYNNRGIVFRKKGQTQLALADYTKAIDLNPHYANAYNNRANLYNNRNQFDLAIADYSKE